MLGQIPLAQWKCLAELLDNSIDAFVEASRSGKPIAAPQVVINVPLTNVPTAQITVRDNGPGMDSQTLERAAKAGWSGRDPINNLGLFGMGFNIATARLGSRTTVWTTRAGDQTWTGLEIDFDRLTLNSTFLTTALQRPKADSSESGTEIVLQRLKPEMREWFARATNRTQISKHLGRTYSAMLGAGGLPIKFHLELNGATVRSRPHCIWGGPGNAQRSANHPTLGLVNAFQEFDFDLPRRRYCVSCWNWLGSEQHTCPQCGNDGKVVDRERRVRGWLGIQRYQDETDFGVDFLRNGRKIEVGSKDLFAWRDPDSDEEIIEYPIDDQRHRGRIVGEIHLDHCQVPYTKERFLREDAAWSEMVELVRGKGPLQPRIAEARGMGGNSSPLYKLYQVYRRSSPQGRAGSWAKLLVVRDDVRAREMAKRFENAEPEYQTDTKWYELAEEEDNKNLLSGGSGSGGATLGGGAGLQPTTQPGQAPIGSGPLAPGPIAMPPVTGGAPSLPSQPIREFSREFRDELTGQLFSVVAFAGGPAESVPGGQPWQLRKTSTGNWCYYVNPSHPVFQSATLTPLDALLFQIAHFAEDIEENQGTPHKLPAILASLRKKYAIQYRLDTVELAQKAAASLKQIAVSVAERASPETLASFFNDECSPNTQEHIRGAMARRATANPQQAIQDGRFLQYGPPQVIMDFVMLHPEELFDGKFWDEQYVNVDFGSSAANEEARKRVLSYYASLMADAVWLAQLDESEKAATRERLLRASLATDLLAPTIEVA